MPRAVSRGRLATHHLVFSSARSARRALTTSWPRLVVSIAQVARVCRRGPNWAGEPIGSPSCSASRAAIGCQARISITRPSVGAERRLPRLVLRLQGRFEEHGADAAVGPRPARLSHADVWIGGLLVEPGAGPRLLH